MQGKTLPTARGEIALHIFPLPLFARCFWGGVLPFLPRFLFLKRAVEPQPDAQPADRPEGEACNKEKRIELPLLDHGEYFHPEEHEQPPWPSMFPARL